MNGGENQAKKEDGAMKGKRFFFLSSFFIGVLGIRKRGIGDERFEKGRVKRVQ